MSLEVVGEVRRGSYGFLAVSDVVVRAADGGEATRTVVRHPGAVVIVAIRRDGVVLAQQQFRAALGREVLELPAGKRDVPGESVIETARRELAEECGVVADHLVEIGAFYNSPGFCDERTWVVAATGLRTTSRTPQSPEEDEATLVGLRLDELDDLVATGTLEDAKSIVGLAMARAQISRLTIDADEQVLEELTVLGPGRS